jgi:holo-[acyl-carrier protein] synthase
MILGVGIDVVDIGRFEESMARTPTLRERLFTPQERERPLASLAARFAAKEALAKALGAPTGMAWHDAEVVSESSGNPQFEIRGSVLARAEQLGARSVHVSLSHDAGIASAVVVLES